MKKFTTLLIFSLIVMGNSVHSSDISDIEDAIKNVAPVGVGLALGTAVCTVAVQAGLSAAGITSVDLEPIVTSCAFLTLGSIRTGEQEGLSVANAVTAGVGCMGLTQVGSYATGFTGPETCMKGCAALTSAFMIAARASKK